MDKIEELLAAMRAGVKLSPDQEELFLKSMKTLSSGKSPDAATGDYKDANYFTQQFAGALDSFKNSKEGKESINSILRDKAGDRFVKNYKPFFNTLLQGADIATSLSQIKNANQAVKALIQPTIPQAPGVDPALNNEINKAQRGTFDTARALAPVRQANQDAYNQQDFTARAVSGGQSGQYGAIKQASYNDLLRANGQLPAIADSIKAREQGNLNHLLATRGQQVQQNFANNLQGTQLAMDQYNRNAQTAAALGAQGRSNLRNVFQTLPDNLLKTVGGYTAQTGQPQTPNVTDLGSGPTMAQPSTYGNYQDTFDQYGDAVQRSLAQHMVRMKNRRITNPIQP